MESLFLPIKDIIDINTNNSYIDVNDGLIMLEDIVPIEYSSDKLIFVPILWKPYIHCTQNNYNIKFDQNFPVAYDLLNEVDNVVIAGGTALWPILCAKNPERFKNDFDIFIYGILELNEFWLKVQEINMCLTKLIRKHYCNLETINAKYCIKKGLVIIYITNIDKTLKLEFQIILRMYHTLSSIIHGFDVPSSCICFDGKLTYTTTIGAYAISHQLNIINLKTRSSTYELRIKKYSYRNFGILFPYLCSKSINRFSFTISVGTFCFTGLTFENNICKFNCIYENGLHSLDETYDTIILPSSLDSFDEVVSYFETIENSGIELHYTHNVLQNHGTVELHHMNNMNLYNIIKTYNINTTRLINKFVSKILSYSLLRIKKLKIPKKIIIDILNIENGDYIELVKNLEEFIKIEYDHIPQWVISQNPMKQYTSSIFPILTNDEEWYGSLYDSGINNSP